MKNVAFLNGRSYHPQNVFKGIIIEEVKRFKILHELDFKENFVKLENECLRSKLNYKILKANFKNLLMSITQMRDQRNRKI